MDQQLEPHSRLHEIAMTLAAPLATLRELTTLLRSQLDRGARWRLAVAAALVSAGAVLAGLAPLILQDMINAAPGTTAHSSPLMQCAQYLLVLSLARLIAELAPFLTGVAEQSVCASISRRYLDHLFALPLSFHVNQRASALVHELFQALTGFQLIITNCLVVIVPAVVELMTVSLVLHRFDQPFLLVAFAVGTALHVGITGLGSLVMRRPAENVAVAGMDAYAKLSETLHCIETVKAMNTERSATQQFARVTHALRQRWCALHRLRLMVGMVVIAAFALTMSACLGFATNGSPPVGLSSGALVLVAIYLVQTFRPVEALGAATRDLLQALEFVRPLLGVLRERTDARERVEPVADSALADSALARPVRRKEPKAPSVQFEDVHFEYEQGRPVLKGFDLKVLAGSTVGVVGTTGSGKSSLVRLLLRLHEPRAGNILLDGVSIRTMPAHELRARTGVVLQETALFNDTIAANIGITNPGATTHEIRLAARMAHLHERIESLPNGYDTLVGERGARLSGGERQRIAIARAILRRPRLFVLDEATSMLDARTEALVLAQLREICAGCTTIMVAHRLSTLRLADEIVVIEDGMVVEQGRHDALVSRTGRYAQLWRMQQRDG